MGHILLGLPEIEHFHLHSRVARKLASREHRVTVLTTHPVSFEFYCHQGLACRDLRPVRRPPSHQIPVAEFGEIDCRLAGVLEPSTTQVHRASARLERSIGSLIQLFETDRPDLVMFHAGRTGLHRMLHFLACQYGSKVFHTGPGLMPMTLQVDPDGIDGDASFSKKTSQDYRRARADEEFLDAVTVAWLGRAYPPPLARIGVNVPPLPSRWIAALRACWRGYWREGFRGVGAWTQSYPSRPRRSEHYSELPPPPFVAVLLQNNNDPRLRLDAGVVVTHDQLIRATSLAARELGPDVGVVVVRSSDDTGMDREDPDTPDLMVVPHHAAALVAATAMAVVTVNHPLGLAAILAGTPVLHLGRTPYGVRGVSHHTAVPMLAQDLMAAVRAGQPGLRKRFLTRMLKEHHIWCPPSQPDSNGVAGLVSRMEKYLDTPKSRTRPLRYRPGPVWPLQIN